jgi:hypothetical protein
LITRLHVECWMCDLPLWLLLLNARQMSDSAFNVSV